MKKLITSLAIFIYSSIFSQSTYLHCGQLFDSKKAKFIGPHTIIIDGEKITSVIKGYINPKSENDILIDLKSKTVYPGFIDMHVHHVSMIHVTWRPGARSRDSPGAEAPT